jgi:hypothetical protein
MDKKAYEEVFKEFSTSGFGADDDISKITCALVTNGANYKRVLKITGLKDNKETKEWWRNLKDCGYIKSGQKRVYMENDFEEDPFTELMLMNLCAMGIIKREMENDNG